MPTATVYESAYDKIKSIREYLQDNIAAISDFSNMEILTGEDKEAALDILDDIIENMTDAELTSVCNDIANSEVNAAYKIDWNQYRKVK